MKPRICRCCGEPMSEKGNGLPRNPNVCAACSSMEDGMGESNVPELADLESEQHPTPVKLEEGSVVNTEAAPRICETPVAVTG